MNIPIVMNERFLEYAFFNKKGKYRIYWGGAGSGKSYQISMELVMQAVEKQHKILVLRQTNNSNRESTFATICEVIKNMGLTHLVNIRQTTMDIEFKHNGSKFIFRGCDEESRLLSLQGVDIAFLEEVTEISKEIFSQVVLRIRPPLGGEMIYMAFNPVSSNHWIKEIVDDPFYTQENGFAMHSTYKDNLNHLPDSYVQALEDMRRTNPSKARIYADGNWGFMGKLVYNNWKVENFDIDKVMKQYPKAVHRCGIDWGFMADESCVLSALIDIDSKQIWIENELYEKHLHNDEIYKWIVDNGYSKAKFTADSSENKSISDLKRMGIRNISPAKKGVGSINQGILFLESFTIHVAPRCKGTISEFEQYAYKKDKTTGEYTNSPIDKFNHAMDTLRYLAEEFMLAKKKLHSVSKSILGI